MRHASPETKQRSKRRMADQVRKTMERANRRVYQASKVLHFYDTESAAENQKQTCRVSERCERPEGKWRALGDDFRTFAFTCASGSI